MGFDLLAPDRRIGTAIYYRRHLAVGPPFMKKSLIKLSILTIALAGVLRANAQFIDVHNPAALGLYRGIPYLSTWSQRWLTNGNSAGAIKFLMADTNGPVALWNFIQPFASLQNTNALTVQQQSALDQIVSGTINNSLNFQGNSIYNASTLGSPEWDVSVPAVVSINGGTLWGEFHPDAWVETVNGFYTFAGNLVVGKGAMATGLVPFYLRNFTTAIVGLPNATRAKIFAYSGGALQPNPYFPFGGVVNFFVATDVNSTDWSLFVTSLTPDGGFSINLYYTTATLPANYIYGRNQDPSLTMTATGLTPLYAIKINTNNDLAIFPASTSSSNLMAQSVNFYGNSFTANAMTSSVFAGPLVGDASHATGITPGQVGAVSLADSTYLSIPTLANNITANSTAISAVQANTSFPLNSAPFQIYTNPITPYYVQGATTIAGAPYVNTYGRRGWLYVNYQRTNTFSITLSNVTTSMMLYYSNSVPAGQTCIGNGVMDMPASPGDTIQIYVNAITNCIILRAWSVGI
jgi:hypothetical protein